MVWVARRATTHNNSCLVLLFQTVTVPPRSEMIVPAKLAVDRKTEATPVEALVMGDGVLETHPSFLSRFPLLVGKTLVRPAEAVVPALIANLTSAEQMVPANTCIAVYSPVASGPVGQGVQV